MRARRIILVAAAVLGLLACSLPASSWAWDRHFQAQTKRFFGPGFDWRWFKAQARAESALRPEAVSPVGARGLMQLMPFTSREMAQALKIPDAPFNPRANITMGIAYDRRLWNIWQTPRPDLERLRLTFASYNAGAGHIIKAQRLAARAGRCSRSWRCVLVFLPRVTGRHSRETINYVDRIEAFHVQLLRLEW